MLNQLYSENDVMIDENCLASASANTIFMQTETVIFKENNKEEGETIFGNERSGCSKSFVFCYYFNYAYAVFFSD